MVAGISPSLTCVARHSKERALGDTLTTLRSAQSERAGQRTSDSVKVAEDTHTLMSAVDTSPTPPPNAVPAP